MPVRAVLDTNVLISSLIATQGHSHHLFAAWQRGKFTLITSEYLLQELRHVVTYPRIAKRLRLSEAELAVLFLTLAETAVVVPDPLQLPGATRDPKDDPVIACAVAGNAEYIVSGDQDILTLVVYETVRMVTPAQFIQILDR